MEVTGYIVGGGVDARRQWRREESAAVTAESALTGARRLGLEWHGGGGGAQRWR